MNNEVALVQNKDRPDWYYVYLNGRRVGWMYQERASDGWSTTIWGGPGQLRLCEVYRTRAMAEAAVLAAAYSLADLEGVGNG